MAWVIEHWRLYRGWLPLILVLTLLNALIVVVYPLIFKQVIDGIADAKSETYLVWQTMFLIGIAVCHYVVYALLQYYRAVLNLSFEYSVRLRAFEHVTRKGQSFFGHFRTGDLVTRLMDDVSQKLSWYMCSGLFRVLEAAAVVVFCIVAMLSISPWLTLVAAGPLPLLILSHVFTSNRLHDRYEQVQQTISQLNDSLETCFSGIRVVKSFTAEQMQREALGRAIEENRAAEVRAVRWQTVVDTMWGHIWQLGIIGILLVGGGMAMDGDVTLGDLVAFDAYVLLMVWPMWDFGQFFVRGRLSSVTIDRVAEIEHFPLDVMQLELPVPVARTPSPEVLDDYQPCSPSPNGLDIDVDNVEFRFISAESPALKEMTFQAKAGQITAIVGETGVGKSTTLALLPRLICPTKGKLRVVESASNTDEMKSDPVAIDAGEIENWDLIELRQKIGYVPQESNLLSGSIEENIRFGREWIAAEDIAKSIKMAQLSDEIENWPEGLQTVVGSRGVRLSGGQKQRVALARAIAGRPAILLLDDCTSSLDAATEANVWKSLLKELPHCTILLVTHRASTLREVDQILMIEDGVVVESGTFKQLNVMGTCFHRLYGQWKLRDHIG